MRIDRQARVQVTHIIPPKLVCARGKFSLVLHFLLCICFSSIHPTHTELLCTITTAVEKHKWDLTWLFIGAPLHCQTIKIRFWMRYRQNMACGPGISAWTMLIQPATSSK